MSVLRHSVCLYPLMNNHLRLEVTKPLEIQLDYLSKTDHTRYRAENIDKYRYNVSHS